jgi:putative ABC transport system substrate-binding protein
LHKRITTLVLCALIIAHSFPAAAQQAKKVPRIGYLSASDAARESSRVEAIRLALRELGYIEGQNIAFEYRYAAGKRDQFPELAADLVRLKVDIIVVVGGNRIIPAAKNATKTIPIVMTGAGLDPVEAGFVESLARPGGNVTGLTNLGMELGGKRLELLKEAVAKLARVAVLYDRANPSSVVSVKEGLPVAARALGLTVRSWDVRDAGGFERVFTALNKDRPDGLYVLGGELMIANEKRTVGFTIKSRLPSVYGNREAVEAGGLMSYGADVADSYRRVAYYVDKILKGAKPAELPVEQPTKFELVINLKTAKQIGVTIPPDVLARASRLIK